MGLRHALLVAVVLYQLLLLASSNPVAHQKQDPEESHHDDKPKQKHHHSHHHRKSHHQKKSSHHGDLSDAQMPEAARVVEEEMDKKAQAVPVQDDDAPAVMPKPAAHDPLEKIENDKEAKPLANHAEGHMVKSSRVVEEEKKRDSLVMAEKPSKVEEIGDKKLGSNVDQMAKPALSESSKLADAGVGGVKSARVEEQKKSKKDDDMDIVKRMLKDQDSKSKLSEGHSHGEAVKREASLFGDVSKMTDEERKLLLELEKQRGLAADRTKQEEEADRRKRLMEELSPIKESGKKEGEDKFRDFKMESGLESLKAKQEEKSNLDDLMKKAKDKDSSKEKDDKLKDPLSVGITKIESQPKIIKPDVDVKKCEDMGSEEACKAFKPLCPMFPARAYYFCRKTCERCAKDTPKGMELKAKIPDVEGCITLSQCAPRTTVFMAACVKPKAGNAIKAGKEYGIEVHEYATIEKDGAVCKDIGPEFNPFNTLRGGPMSTMKKTGNLGNIKFSADNKLPDSWPKEKAEKLKCPDGHLAAYAAYNHFCLHDLYSVPAYKPIVIHEKRDNLGVSMMMRNEKKDGGGNTGKGLLCGMLECTEEHKDKLKEKGWTMPKKDEKKGEEEGKEKDDKKKEDKDSSKEGGEKTPLEGR